MNLFADSVRQFGTPGGKVCFIHLVYSNSFSAQPYNHLNSDIQGIESDIEYAQDCIANIDDDDEEKEGLVTVRHQFVFLSSFIPLNLATK